MDEFEDLKGYENCYKINRKGDIMSCRYSKIMTPQLTEDGYFWVKLVCKDKQRHKCSIHRLLALQYIPNPENKPEIDHINRNRKDNDLSNLRWVDKIEQNNNKSNCLSAEQKEVRKVEITAYKKEWAKQSRAKMTDEQRAEKKLKDRLYKQQKAEEMTDEQRAEMNRKRREERAAKKASV